MSRKRVSLREAYSKGLDQEAESRTVKGDTGGIRIARNDPVEWLPRGRFRHAREGNTERSRSRGPMTQWRRLPVKHPVLNSCGAS